MNPILSKSSAPSILFSTSVASEWRYVRDNDMVLTCLDIFMEEGYTANLSLPNLDDEWLPFLWLDGQAGLTQSLSSQDSELCLNGVDQALPFGVQSMIEHVMIGNTSFMVGFDTTWPHIVSASEEGWLIDEYPPWGHRLMEVRCIRECFFMHWK